MVQQALGMSIIYGSTSIGNEHHILVQLASTMKVMWYNNYQQGTLSWFNKHWQWTLLYWFNKHWATNIIILVQQALAKHQMLACFLTSKVWYPLDGAKICQGADVRIPIKTLAIICLVVLIWFDFLCCASSLFFFLRFYIFLTICGVNWVKI